VAFRIPLGVTLTDEEGATTAEDLDDALDVCRAELDEGSGAASEEEDTLDELCFPIGSGIIGMVNPEAVGMAEDDGSSGTSVCPAIRAEVVVVAEAEVEAEAEADAAEGRTPEEGAVFAKISV